MKDLLDIGGYPILKEYNNSLFSLLSSVYPQYNLLPWKFEKRPQNFWEDTKIQRNFIEWAGKQFNIKEMSDWYKVSVKVNKKQIFKLKFFQGME
jgi:hypothetical protein